MSSRKNDYKKNEYTDEDFNGINSLLRAAETLDKDRIKDLIDVDKTLSEIDREVIKQYINSQPSLTSEQMLKLINDMRMNKMTLFNRNPTVHSVENFRDETKALSQTRDEREQAKMAARTEPRSEMNDEELENYITLSTNTLGNTDKKRKLNEIPPFGGKRRNKTRGKSRRRTRKSRRSRKP